PEGVVGLHAEDEVDAAAQVETEPDLLGRRGEGPDRERRDADDQGELPVEAVPVHVLEAAALRRDDRLLSLVTADRGTGDFDPDLIGNLQLHRVLVDPGDLSVDPAGGDDTVADLQARLEVLDLLLPPAHG